MHTLHKGSLSSVNDGNNNCDIESKAFEVKTKIFKFVELTKAVKWKILILLTQQI